MNVSRLLEFIDEILDLEDSSNVQGSLRDLDGALQNVVNQPQDASQQTNAAKALASLESAIDLLNENLTPAAWEFLVEHNSDWAFSQTLAENISKEMAANGITPAVAKAASEDLTHKRQKLLDHFRGAKTQLEALGFQPLKLEPGTAELGFLIPRDLFQNTLGGVLD